MRTARNHVNDAIDKYENYMPHPQYVVEDWILESIGTALKHAKKALDYFIVVPGDEVHYFYDKANVYYTTAIVNKIEFSKDGVTYILSSLDELKRDDFTSGKAHLYRMDADNELKRRNGAW